MEEGNSIPRGRIISCQKACKMLSDWCLYHIVIVKDLDSKTPPIELIPVLREFLEIFPNDILENPPEWEIDFHIGLLLDTNPIAIPLYGMAPPN